MTTRRTPTRTGFSLVLSLIILTLLAILVVGFLSSTAMDRATAHAFSDKAKAEAAAGTAANQAVSMLREYIAQYPDSATVWEKLTPANGGPAVEGTMLYYAEQPPSNGINPNPTNTVPKRFILPLISLGVDANGIPLGPVEIKDKAKVLGADPWHEAYWNNGKNEPDCIDLNRPQSNEDEAGWIGAPTDGRKPYYAKWIEVKENNDPAGKTISRYAFWVEDESFKLNLNLLDNNKRGSELSEKSRIRTDDFANNPLPPQIAALVPLQGLLRNTRTPSDREAVASGIKTLRDAFLGKRLADLRSYNHLTVPFASASGSPALIGDNSKFFATVFSGGLNLSRHGTQRLNLNGLGFEKSGPTDAEIDKQIKQIVEAINYHAPKFGQRFYRLTPNTDAATLNAEYVSDSGHRNIYLHKIAANIRDYIDPDSQPTIIANTGKVVPRVPPLLAMQDDNWAQGKDGAPFIQEAVVRFRTSAASGRYNLKIDYYIEFWNMTNRDIYAAPQPYDKNLPHLDNAFVKIADPVAWFGHGGGTPSLLADTPPHPDDKPTREVTINLTKDVFLGDKNGFPQDGKSGRPYGVVFRAGTCTVITTDPDELSGDKALGTTYSTGGKNLANVYYCSNISGRREFVGPVPTGCDGIWPQFRDGATRQEDYGTEVVFGNALGYLDSHPYTISKGGGPNVTYLPSNDKTKKTQRDDTFGGTLFGNGVSPSQTGDPRTNNEQLTFTRYKPGATAEPDQTRYFNPSASDDNRFSLGWPNSRFVFPDQGFPWKDFYKVWVRTSTDGLVSVINPNADTAPAVIANAPLTSIGELGNIYDPARVKSSTGSIGITGARGGGRTFKIGQPDDLVDSSTTSSLATPSRQWAAWRLTDFLATSGDIQLPGQININGLRRDNGGALRAACLGMTISSVSCSATASAPTVTKPEPTIDSDEYATAPPAGLDRLISQARARLDQANPNKPSYFTERGELSELPLFSSTSADLLPGIPLRDAFDRTREELFRRVAELVTTRGNIFSVYAIGQSINEAPDQHRTKRVTATHQVKVTFALIPKRADGSNLVSNGESFDPTNKTAVADRFTKADHYDVQILQVSNP